MSDVPRNTPVVVLDAPLVTGYGGQRTRDWANARERTAYVNIQPATSVGSATELTDNRDVLLTLMRADFDAGDPIAATSRVRYEGADWEVQGVPGRWTQAGEPHHVEVLLRQVNEPDE